jgi:hypothetical protein
MPPNAANTLVLNGGRLKRRAAWAQAALVKREVHLGNHAHVEKVGEADQPSHGMDLVFPGILVNTVAMENGGEGISASEAVR